MKKYNFFLAQLKDILYAESQVYKNLRSKFNCFCVVSAKKLSVEKKRQANKPKKYERTGRQVDKARMIAIKVRKKTRYLSME